MDWVFDETLKMTYDNPIFLEQKKIRNENVDSTGFVAQYKLKEFVEDIEEDDSSATTKADEDDDDDNDEFEEFDINDFKEDDDVSTMYERMQKTKKASNSTSDSISKSHRMQHSTEQKGSDYNNKKIKFNIKVKKDF